MTRSQSPPHLATIAQKLSRGAKKKIIMRNKLNLAVDEKKKLEFEIQELKKRLKDFEEQENYCEVVKVNF
jgi:regulator of replication initiation timing